MPTIYKPPKKVTELTINKQDAQEVYSSKLWKDLRLCYLHDHPLCEDCMSELKIAPAIEVHHITPFSTGKDINERLRLAYSYNNLMALCVECHHNKHKKL